MTSLDASQPSEGSPSNGGPVTVAKSLLSSFMKASFSMSSLRDGISPEKDCPPSGAAPATLPRRKHQDQLRRASRGKDKKDEFWEALRPDYIYLMDHGLIDTCKEAKGELFWDDEMDGAEDAWSFKEFVAKHDRMCAWVEHMELAVMRPEGAPQSHLADIEAFAAEVGLLNEQAQRLIRRYPRMSDEIGQRTEQLNGLWEALQHCVTSVQGQDEKAALRREIACQMRLLRKWIRSIEEKLGPVLRPRRWEPSEIETKLVHHQELQKEIESRSKAVLTVIKLCERFREQERANCGVGDHEKQFRGSTQALRTATNLQKRFHALWIRSLEWQCLLEELRGAPPRHSLHSSREDDSESDGRGYEPYRKYPRLTTGFRKPAPMEDAAADHACGSTAAAEGSAVAAVDKGTMAGEPDFGRRPPDHQDVGYSSENSAHLSNEESAGEFVRVYTYTSATATSPRVLEVVMDGERRPRRTPLPRQAVAKMDVTDASPNCGTFYFRHEDSDTDRKVRLTRGLDSAAEGGDRSAEDEEDEAEEWPERGRCPERIHRLVSDVDQLVSRPCLDEEPAHSVDSCDASGEYTSSNDSDAESSAESAESSSTSSSASSSSQDQKGSVIHLKMTGGEPAAVPEANAATSDPGNAGGGVRMRTKKRRNGDRPWSVVELDKRSGDRTNLLHFSNSETALHHLSASRPVTKDSAAAKEGDSSPGPRQPRKSTARRRSSKQVDSSSDDKCHSMGSLRHSSSSENGCRNSASSLQGPPRSRLPPERTEAEAMDVDRDDHEVPAAAAAALLMDSENSLSEQAWDDYQDPPYLSEPYSEPGVDDEVVRRIWDFGDDYRAFMESHSDGTSTPSFPSKVRTRQRLTSLKPSSNSRESSVLDSESDFEDLNEVIEQHHKQLRITELQLIAEMSGDPSEPGRHRKISEVLATCQTHLKCLKKVWEQLGEVKLKPMDLNLGVQQAGGQLKHGWEKLLMEAKEHEARLGQLSQLRNEVKAFGQKVKRVMDKASDAAQRLEDRSCLAAIEQDLMDHALCLSKVKQDLTNLNFQIHNFITQTGLEVGCLKEEVVVLYRLWDQVQDAIQEKLQWVRSVDATWREYSDRCDRLNAAASEDERMLATLAAGLKNPQDSMAAALPAFAEFPSVTELKEKLQEIGEAGDHRDPKPPADARACLDELFRSSEKLTGLIGEGAAAEEVKLNSRRMAENVAARQDECQKLVEKLSRVLKKRAEVTKTGFRNGAGVKLSKFRRKGRRSSSPPTLLWRVVRAALPFQLAVVILFCFACLFEPHCCDSVNNLNLSLTPQLRYVRGPPPI